MTNAESPQQTTTSTTDQALQQAITHHQAGQLQEAGEFYLAILKAQPNHPEANHNTGVLAVQMKQPAASLPYFMAALDADPARGQYWLNYIDALIQADQLEDARQILALAQQQGLQGDEVDALAVRLDGSAQLAEQSNAKDPQAPKESPPIPQSGNQKPSHYEIDTLVTLFTEGRLTEAAALAQTMTVRFPLHEFGWKALGAVFKQMGRNADALAPMQKAAALSPGDVEAHYNLGVTLQELGRLDKAEASYRRALQINPDYADAHSNLGVALQKQDRLGEAEASFRRALQINPDNAEAHSNLGVTLHGLGRLDEAEASLRRALQIKPDNAAAHSNLGNTLKGLDRLDEAEASFRRALQINPDYADAHYNLGVTLHGLGRLDEAAASLRRALQTNPDNAEVHFNLGNILLDIGRPDEAEASYRRALQIEPDYAEAHSNLGITLKSLSRLDEAEASLRRALQVNSDNVEAHSNLGITLKELGRLNEAEACYRQALQRKPDFAEAHFNLGNILLDIGRLDEAEASYRRALQIKPDFAEAHFNLGDTLSFMGNQDQAIARWKKALAIDPDEIGLDAAVWLALLYWLEGNYDQFCHMFLVSELIMATTDDKHNSMRIYRGYLGRLQVFHQQSGGRECQQKCLETLYVVGESHSLSAHGVVVHYREREMRCSTQWIAGCKQWHLGNGKTNKYKHKFEVIMAKIPRRSTILLTIGEIDCRPDEGIINAWKKTPAKSLEDVAYATASGYVSYVKGIASHYGHQMVIGGVPATNVNLNTLGTDVDKQLVELIRIFNVALKDLTLTAGMDFLDVYGLTNRGDGIASEQWHIDPHHLLPIAMTEAFERYCFQSALFQKMD